MASIRAAQVMAWPVSARTLAAASRALSFLGLGLAAAFAGAVSVTAACLGVVALGVLAPLAAARFRVLAAAIGGMVSRWRGGGVPLADGVRWVFLVAMV